MAGPEVYDLDKIDKGNFAAIYTDQESDNGGLPFWIGKVVAKAETRVYSTRDAEDSDDEEEEYRSDEESAEAEPAVEVHEFYVPNPQQAASGKHRLYKEKCTRGPKRPRSGATSAQAVKTWVPVASIGYVFPTLNRDGKIPVTALDWIAYACEVAHKTEYHKCCGVKEFNDDCGFNTL